MSRPRHENIPDVDDGSENEVITLSLLLFEVALSEVLEKTFY